MPQSPRPRSHGQARAAASSRTLRRKSIVRSTSTLCPKHSLSCCFSLGSSLPYDLVCSRYKNCEILSPPYFAFLTKGLSFCFLQISSSIASRLCLHSPGSPPDIIEGKK